MVLKYIKCTKGRKLNCFQIPSYLSDYDFFFLPRNVISSRVQTEPLCTGGWLINCCFRVTAAPCTRWFNQLNSPPWEPPSRRASVRRYRCNNNIYCQWSRHSDSFLSVIHACTHTRAHRATLISQMESSCYRGPLCGAEAPVLLIQFPLRTLNVSSSQWIAVTRWQFRRRR